MPLRGASNEYHNICFHGEEKYQYFLVEKVAHLDLGCGVYFFL